MTNVDTLGNILEMHFDIMPRDLGTEQKDGFASVSRGPIFTHFEYGQVSVDFFIPDSIADYGPDMKKMLALGKHLEA